MSARRVARDLAYGVAMGASAGIGLVSLVPVPTWAALAGLDMAPRVSSVVGARYDNFNPGARLDTSQVVWGETCERVAPTIPECDAGHMVNLYSAARHRASVGESTTARPGQPSPAETE